ncbi:MAG TPA: hypothetical protein VNN79_09345, partial [Actinomycetota bacterium]|nr:hypothetical protein [Actinomycetota bacterium]
MPTINDYDAEEQKRPNASSGTVYAPGTPPHEQEFTPWSRLVSANKSVSDREAGKLGGQVQGDVDKAKGELDSAQQSFNSGFDANYGKTSQKASGPM